MEDPKIRIRASDDTGPAFRSANNNLRELQESAATIGASLGGALGAAGIAALVTGAIDAADELAKLSQRAGVTVDVMGGLAFNADLAGVSLEQIGSASDKLNRTLAEAASGTQLSAEGFNLLGVAVVDAAGKTRQVDAVMADVADKFANFADGPEKTAIAVRLFGKAGAELIPLLNGGGAAIRENTEYYQRFSGVTQELAERSEVFNDTMSKVQLIGSSLGNNLASELLPALQAVADELLRISEAGGGFPALGKAVRAVFETIAVLAANVEFVLSSIGREIGAIAAQAVALSTLDFKAFTAISDAVKADGVRARAELDALERRILGIGLPSVNDESAAERRRLGLDKADPAKRNAPRLAPTGGTGADKQVKELNLANKALESYAEQLQNTITKTQDLTTVEEALIFLRRKGAGASLDDAARILNLARQVDETKRLKEETQALINLDKTLEEQARAKVQEREDNLQRLIDATPTAQLEKSRADIILLTEEFQKFVDTAGKAGINEQTYLEAVSARLDITAAKLEKSKSIAEELGLTFASAAEEAIIHFNKLGDVVRGVLQDAARIVVRKNFTEPFAKYVTGALGGLFSFDGGGYTGGGSRSGGVDGKGGFLAVMHPQETVYDHTKGQGGGSGGDTYYLSVGDHVTLARLQRELAANNQRLIGGARRNEVYA